MDLTSGAPFWIIKDGLLATYPRLREDRRCDVAVIGGGITGGLVAHRFVREGIHVILVERREIGFGSTGATTALIQYEIDTTLCDLMDRVGEANAVRSYQLSQDSVRGIERLATEDGNSCGFQRKKSLYLASRPRDRRTLEQECAARRRIGIEVDLLSSRDIGERFSFGRPAALLSHLAGEVDGLPYIGTVPQFPHGYFALGYGGNGITFSYIAAELLLDPFRQGKNRDREIFQFDR